MSRFLAVLLILGSSLTSRADDPLPGIPLRVAVDSNLKIVSGDAEPIKLRAQAVFDYRLDRKGDTIVSAIDRMSLMSEADGKELMFAEMSHDGMTDRRNGKTETVGPNDPNGEMFAQFGAPLMAIQVDAEGAEIARELKVKSGPLTQSNAVENTRIFHPKFATNAKEWDAPANMALGQGQTASGTLHYKKRPARKDGLIDVDVSGVLHTQGKLAKTEIKHADYTVSGVQSYHPALREWVEGKLTVQMDFEGVSSTGQVVKGTGPVTLTLTRRDPKTRAAVPQ
jgi:hypothetical protein